MNEKALLWPTSVRQSKKSATHGYGRPTRGFRFLLQKNLSVFLRPADFNAFFLKDFLHAFYRISFFIQIIFNNADQFDIIRAIVTAAAVALHRLNLGKLGLPKTQDMQLPRQVLRLLRQWF